MNINIQMYSILALFIVLYQSTNIFNLHRHLPKNIQLLFLLALVLFTILNENYTITLLIVILYFVCMNKDSLENDNNDINNITTQETILTEITEENNLEEETNETEETNDEDDTHIENSVHDHHDADASIEDDADAVNKEHEKQINEVNKIVNKVNQDVNNLNMENENKENENMENNKIKEKINKDIDNNMYLLLNNTHVDDNIYQEINKNSSIQLDSLTQNNNNTFCN